MHAINYRNVVLFISYKIVAVMSKVCQDHSDCIVTSCSGGTQICEHGTCTCGTSTDQSKIFITFCIFL